MRTTILAFTLMAAGCTATAGGDQAARNIDVTEDVSVEFRIENGAGAPASRFSTHDTARFVFELRNDGQHAQRLAFTFPPHRVSVARDGQVVWQAFHGQMFPQVMRTQELPPGETIEFAVEWNIHEHDAVTAGVYTVQPEFIGFLQPGNRPVRPAFEPLALTLHDDAARGGAR